MNNGESAKINELAQTLKKNGLAGSDTEAMRMAKSMTSTEDRVNKNFEEKKSTMIKNYDFEKAKNGAATYGANPSTGIKSQIKNAESAIGNPKTTESSNIQKNSTQQQVNTQESNSPSWEKEAATQNVEPVRVQKTPVQTSVSPQSLGSNGAINNAISKVQERFAQQSSQQINPELPAGLTLNDASSTSEVKIEEVAQQETPQEETPKIELPREEITQQEEAPHEEAQVNTQEENSPSAVVEQTLPSPEIEIPQQETTEQETPQQETNQEETNQENQQANAPAFTAEEENEMPEKTQEMPRSIPSEETKAKYKKVKIDLTDVFNVNK